MEIPSSMRHDDKNGLLREGERIDDLCRDGYCVIQHPDKFCFGMDAVFLTDFVPEIGTQARVLDMGTGTGVIPILLYAKKKGGSFVGLELQKEIADMAERSVRLNQLSEHIQIVRGDIKEASSIFGGASFDVVVTNPPYMKQNGALLNHDENKAIARHEIMCTLEDVIREASGVLRDRGRFFMINRPNRLTEILEYMKQYRMEAQRVVFVHPFSDKNANMVMVEGRKGCSAFLKVEPPIIVYEHTAQ